MKVLVVGLGKSGQATARFLLSRVAHMGITSLTLVDSAQSETLGTFLAELKREYCDAVDIRSAFGANLVPSFDACDDDGKSYDLCVITPGLAPHTALSKSAYEHSREVISELELAYRMSPPELTWIAVTGTNGKTTTTELIRELLSAAGGQSHFYSVGNIGTPALEMLDQVHPGDCFVAEVSSFQAARFSDFSPRVAVLLNLSSDHLDWHKDIASYAADKCAIFANSAAGDLVLVPDQSQLHPEARPVVTAAVKAARSRGAEVCVIQTDEACLPLAVSELNIRGKHNLTNACFALAIARYFDVSDACAAQALKNFRPQPHRMQEVGRYRDVLYVNDSKSTNPDASMQALSAYPGLELTLLLGGQGKSGHKEQDGGTGYLDLARTALARAKTILLFGQAAAELKTCFDALVCNQAAQPQIACFNTMVDAVTFACENAVAQQVVLLSPANASFDEFDNYEERGHVFAQLVEKFNEERN